MDANRHHTQRKDSPVSSTHPTDPTDQPASKIFANGEHLHVIVRDPATGRVLDFELIPLPLTVEATVQALHELRVRNQQRQAAAHADQQSAPKALRGPSPERVEIERRRHAEMVERLRPLAPLITRVSPYREPGERS